MSHRTTGIVFLLISPVWFWLALGSFGRGKDGLALLQLVVGLAFIGRGVFELRKQQD